MGRTKFADASWDWRHLTTFRKMRRVLECPPTILRHPLQALLRTTGTSTSSSGTLGPRRSRSLSSQAARREIYGPGYRTYNGDLRWFPLISASDFKPVPPSPSQDTREWKPVFVNPAFTKPASVISDGHGTSTGNINTFLAKLPSPATAKTWILLIYLVFSRHVTVFASFEANEPFGSTPWPTYDGGKCNKSSLADQTNWPWSREELQEMVCGTVCHKWWHGRLPEHDMTTLKRLKVEGQALGHWFDTIIPVPSSHSTVSQWSNLVMPLASGTGIPPFKAETTEWGRTRSSDLLF
ncbi:hypothetical protein B0H13DRAFT_1906948 [Mycena leptocephala]|nr:hypothetical protein B0H13DRAFT_1906948 [Mycena leptocephala]